MIDLASERKDYNLSSLDESSIDPNPLNQFRNWLKEAVSAKVGEPTAMNLSTIGFDGYPSSRIVLLKGIDEGFVFYTNYESAKGKQLLANPKAALTFHWVAVERQVRITGDAVKVDAEMSDQYFHSRPFESQLAAVASPQSQVIKDRDELETRFSSLKTSNPDSIFRPANWGGFRIIPKSIEFWQGRSNRLHDRLLYSNQVGQWKIARLAP